MSLTVCPRCGEGAHVCHNGGDEFAKVHRIEHLRDFLRKGGIGDQLAAVSIDQALEWWDAMPDA